MSDIKIEDDYLPSYELKKVQELFSPFPSSDKKSFPPIPWELGIIQNQDPHFVSPDGNETIENPYFSPDDKGSYDNYQLCHHIYHGTSPSIGIDPLVTPSAHVIIPIFFSKIDAIGILRIKANLLMRTSEIIPHSFHTDYECNMGSNRYDKATTSIFYLNTNDGYTEFEDGTRIESVANRLVTFPNHMKHRGTTCTNKPFRMVINFNYF